MSRRYKVVEIAVNAQLGVRINPEDALNAHLLLKEIKDEFKGFVT